MKRADIQGLRCLCIIMVLLYHYYPKYFPQGRLGVDMFFVISGFLIALMLSKKKDGFLDYCIQFYWRRIKRILPLCYLVFLISFISMYLLQLDTFITMNRHFGRKALFFVANIRVSEEDDYEAQLTGAKILLTHYWSLSTEVQFYLLAPFIVLFIHKESVLVKTSVVSFLSFASLVHYVTASEAISFNSPLARLWQFLAGFIAYYNCSETNPKQGYGLLPADVAADDCKQALLGNMEKQEHLDHEDDDEDSKNPETRPFYRAYILSVVSLATVIGITVIPAPNILLDTVFRIVVTMCTGWIVMAAGKNPKLLEFRLFEYVGDISFALYLVHWPILCFVKTFEQEFVTTFAIPIAFVLSVVLAIVLHEVFEKRYLKWGTTLNILVILTLVLGCAALVFVDFESNVIAQTVGVDEDFFERAIKGNRDKNIAYVQGHMVMRAKGYQLDGFEHTGLQIMKPAGNLTGTGNLTILIIGNSYAGNQANLIYAGLTPLFKDVYLYWRHTCEAMITTIKNDRKFCVTNPYYNTELVELLKPDLLFIVERGVSMKYPINATMVLEDSYMQTLAQNMEHFQKYTKRIFVMGPIRKLVDSPASVAIEYLKKKQRLRDSPSLVMNDNMYQKIRLGKLPEVCQKCVVYEWEHIFYNSTGHFEPYDPETDILYFDNIMHLGDEGMKKMVVFYKELAKELQWMQEKGQLLM